MQIKKDSFEPILVDAPNGGTLLRVELPFSAKSSLLDDDEFKDRSNRDFQMILNFVAREVENTSLSTVTKEQVVVILSALKVVLYKKCAFMRGYLQGHENLLNKISSVLKRWCFDNLPKDYFVEAPTSENEISPKKKQKAKELKEMSQLDFSDIGRVSEEYLERVRKHARPQAVSEAGHWRRSEGPLIIAVPEPKV